MPEYANGKCLVVFVDGAEKWYPNRVGRRMDGQHNFNAIYCVGLLIGNDSGYLYSVSRFNKKHSPTWKVRINSDFTSWKVSQIQ